jgi:hypothetical protein
MKPNDNNRLKMVKIINWTRKHRTVLVIGAIVIAVLLAGSLLLRFGFGQSSGKTIRIGYPANASEKLDYSLNANPKHDTAQFQAALNALPPTGGQIEITEGKITLNANITRAIPDVTISGTGQGTYLALDGDTPVFTAGGNNWVFANLKTDAGAISDGTGSNITWENVTAGTTYYVYRTSEDTPAISWEIPAERPANYVIATPTAPDEIKAKADLVASETTPAASINAAFKKLSTDRTSVETIELIGDFGNTIEKPILVPSYTELRINGKIGLKDDADCVIIANSDPVKGNTQIHITGGDIYGNSANQATTGYGIKFTLVTNSSIDIGTISYCKKTGILVTKCEAVDIRFKDISYCESHGFYALGATNGTFNGLDHGSVSGYAHHNGYGANASGVVFYYTNPFNTVNVRSCYNTNSGLFFDHAGYNKFLANCDSNGTGMYIGYSDGIVGSATLRDNSGPGLQISNTSDSSITVSTSRSGKEGVLLQGCYRTELEVKSNRSGREGIKLTGCNDCDISGITSDNSRSMQGQYQSVSVNDCLRNHLSINAFDSNAPIAPTALPVTGAVGNNGGYLTDETILANNYLANDITFLPAAPTFGDSYIILSSDLYDGVRFKIGTPGVGTWAGVWEYSTGAKTWAIIPHVSDSTSGFTASAGSHDVTFDKTELTGWAPVTMKSKTGYAIQYRITSAGAITTLPLGTRAYILTGKYTSRDIEETGTSDYNTYITNDCQTNGSTTEDILVTGANSRIICSEDGTTGKTTDSGFTPNVSDNGTITYDLVDTPTYARVIGSIPGEKITITSANSTTITIRIRKADGSPGTTQNIYWTVSVTK